MSEDVKKDEVQEKQEPEVKLIVMVSGDQFIAKVITKPTSMFIFKPRRILPMQQGGIAFVDWIIGANDEEIIILPFSVVATIVNAHPGLAKAYLDKISIIKSAPPQAKMTLLDKKGTKDN